MSQLTEAERKRIFEEERAKLAAQEVYKQENPDPNKKAKDGIVLSLGSLLVGPLLGIPAIVYGVQGIGHANKYPKAGGKGLSIFNLAFGSITSVTHLILWYTMVLST